MRFLVFLLVLPLVSLFGQTPIWYSNPEAALQQAQNEEKPLLLVFLGSGWCPWSDQVIKDVVSKKEFSDFLHRECILAKVICPAAGLHPLGQKYHVEKCPCFILVEPSGEKIAEVEYLSMDPRSYAQHLKGLLHNFHALKKALPTLHACTLSELKELYSKSLLFAREELKEAILEAGIRIDPGVDFLLEKYRMLLQSNSIPAALSQALKAKILAKDPQDLLDSRFQLALLEFERARSSQSTVDPLQPLLDYVAQAEKKDAPHLWEAEMKISNVFFGRNQLEEALKHARASLEVAPAESQKRVAEAIDYLRLQLEESIR